MERILFAGVQFTAHDLLVAGNEKAGWPNEDPISFGQAASQGEQRSPGEDSSGGEGCSKSVGKRELMREAQIAMRTIDAVQVGQDVTDDDLKHMADAAERIVNGIKKREANEKAAAAWLKAKRVGMGLTALAKMLDVDAANLGKVIEGKRKLPRAVLLKIQSTLVLPEK